MKLVWYRSWVGGLLSGLPWDESGMLIYLLRDILNQSLSITLAT